MAKTAGHTRLPLPPGATTDLKRIGFVYREQASAGLSFYVWQHKRFPSMELQVVRLNLPGSQRLIWKLGASPVENTTEEEMVRRLELTVGFRTNPNVFLKGIES